MTFLKKSIAFSLLAMLAGCSVTPNEPAVTAQDYKESFTGYDLSETNHSEAMQVMHLHSRRAIANANNIDSFTNQNHDKFLAATQGVAVGAALAGSINPFQLATRFIGLEATKSSIDDKYRTNTLISVIAVNDTNDANEIGNIIEDYQSKQLEVARKVYQKGGFKTQKVRSGVEVQWSRMFPRTAMVPMGDNMEKVQLCQNPDIFSEIKDQGVYASEYFECFAITNPVPYLYEHSSIKTQNPLLPTSESFIVVTTVLPDVFPVYDIQMTSENKGVLLYQPTFYWMNSRNIQDYALNDMEALLGFWEKGMFTDEPIITDLATGKVHKFGSNN
ncbi:hypothetical protein NI392_21390 [Vibrio alginolyticus]|nr:MULTISPECIES: hypothetical protein [Vibrio]AVF75475.1 hypothetical protein AL539_17595 [Vibrio alginolyticus]MCA2497098.1 hypothetical protein [Vibrio alginolyticus]MCG6307307.1 hypothetical protein [Vibrio alginolyticus]MDW2073676.1 hypothetical protein [Vibrio sp. 1863]MDW2218402.1 hypothetical protein [Vibrio sp. 2175-1]